jgi:hypothetical protein
MAGKKKEQKEKKEKPLERRTVKELREEALTIPDVQGVHGMNKGYRSAAAEKNRGRARRQTQNFRAKKS